MPLYGKRTFTLRLEKGFVIFFKFSSLTSEYELRIALNYKIIYFIWCRVSLTRLFNGSRLKSPLVLFRNATIDYRRQQWIVLPQQWKTLLLLLLLARAVNLTCRWNIVTQITITNHPTKGIVCVSVKAFEIKVTSFQIYVVRGCIYRCYKVFYN